MKPVINQTITKTIIRINPAWLHQERKKAGMSYRVLGAILNCSGSYLSDVEKGRRNMTDKRMIEIVQRFFWHGSLAEARLGPTGKLVGQ